MKTFILAAGKATRWEAAEYKQLVKIKGERIIDRAISRFPNVTTVVSDKALDDKLKGNCKIIEPTGCICETIMNIEWNCYDSVLFTCGDVYWTTAAVSKVLFNDDKLMFYGNNSEIFAIKISAEYFLLMEYCFTQSIKDFKEKNGRGKLWNAYYTLEETEEHYINPESFTFIKDKTQDFDRYEQYTKYIKCQK